jgi:ribosomal protein S18 acetylase RimI-like enzyme
VRSNASRDETWPGLRELDPAGFAAHLDALMGVYAAAMHVPPPQLPGRRAIMESHLGNPGFRALALTAPPADAPGGAAAAHRDAAHGDAAAAHGDAAAAHGGAAAARGGVAVAAFGYGFHGAGGQWWHDMVRSALTATAGPAVAGHWLDDSFEVAELHVRPEYQKRGVGRRLLLHLTGDRAERTAVLSTMDTESPARRLYRSLGFTDLLTDYWFAGADTAYAVMGAVLPLFSERPLRSRY